MRYLMLVFLVSVLAACKNTSAPVSAPTKAEVPAEKIAVQFRTATWRELPDWPGEQFLAGWPAFLKSCAQIGKRPEWKSICVEANAIALGDYESIRRFFENNFAPWRLENNTGASEAFITGYYDVLLKGSRNYKPGRVPLYGVPNDLLTIDLGDLYPELKGKRVRGRLQGRTVVPYWSRSDIDSGKTKLDANILGWADDPIDAFILHVQGSGRLQFEDGSLLRLGYADQNGQPYRSVGKWLVDRGELTLAQASMPAIRAWAQAHPARVQELIDSNPSFIFFKVTPGASAAIGALNVPLTAGASVAVDPKFIPLGSPLYLATTYPAAIDTNPSDAPRVLHRLVQAQDTGGAIRGPLRVDYFCGSSAEAANLAGVMKQSGQLWLLWPKGLTPAAAP